MSRICLWYSCPNYLYLHWLQNHGNPTSHKPELVLNNFTTRLGHRIGRLLLILCLLYCYWRFFQTFTFMYCNYASLFIVFQCRFKFFLPFLQFYLHSIYIVSLSINQWWMFVCHLGWYSHFSLKTRISMVGEL